jgi:iron(III) transport system permease protein
VYVWLAIGAAAYLFLPWYGIEEGFFSVDWLADYPLSADLAPAGLQSLLFDRVWLLPIGVAFIVPLILRRPRAQLATSTLALAYVAVQGFMIGPLGGAGFGIGQHGMGAGALVVSFSLLMMTSHALARLSLFKGDSTVASILLAIAGGLLLFVFYPVVEILARGVETESGATSVSLLLGKIFSSRTLIITLHSLLLAILSSAGSTLLGASFALISARTRIPGRRALRALTVLPVITPPFVISLALILLFGRTGALTLLLERTLGIAGSRYIFGLPGLVLAQLLSLAPIAFMVTVGVVEGISPRLEEAAQMLRADPWLTFKTVTLPLMRPGLAAAFILCFIESLADFGNPLVLGGAYEVLSTEIYFAIAGSQNDVPRAAGLSMVLLLLTLLAFWAQERWLGDKAYTTVTGKAEAGPPRGLPRSVRALVLGIGLPWAAFTLLTYAIVMAGGFVRVLGRDHTPTLDHYAQMFSIAGSFPSLRFTGGAWSSMVTTAIVAAISAPLTALIGLLSAYLLSRQTFRGKRLFEIGTMLSFAIPGTVVGVSYVLAFNDPPLELTGTAAILVICFAFRNMPVGVRAGMATLAQLDKSLDEASLTLGAGTLETLRRVLLPLSKPAVIAALVYGFVRAMTAVSAVIFLVSADYDLATTYILGRVESGAYGPAIAYCSVLIALMSAVIIALQRAVGRVAIGRGNL